MMETIQSEDHLLTSLGRMVVLLDFRDQWKWGWFCQDSHFTLSFALIFELVSLYCNYSAVPSTWWEIQSSKALELHTSQPPLPFIFCPYFQLEKMMQMDWLWSRALLRTYYLRPEVGTHNTVAHPSVAIWVWVGGG